MEALGIAEQMERWPNGAPGLMPYEIRNNGDFLPGASGWMARRYSEALPPAVQTGCTGLYPSAPQGLRDGAGDRPDKFRRCGSCASWERKPGQEWEGICTDPMSGRDDTEFCQSCERWKAKE